MLLSLSIDESPVFEIGFGRSWVLKFGNFEAILHRAYPGDDAPFSWETEIIDHPGKGSGRPWREHTTSAYFRSWELVASRSYPVPGTVGIDRSVDDDGKPREWTPDWEEEDEVNEGGRKPVSA